MVRSPQFSDREHAHAGRSIREALEDNLLEDVRRYLDMKVVPLAKPEFGSWEIWSKYIEAEKQLAMQRGKVRASAMAVLTWRNMYYLDRTRSVKEIETEFVRRVKNVSD